MSIDRSWINNRFHEGTNCYTREFFNGVDEFLNFAKRNCEEDDEEIRCPCCHCLNIHLKTFGEVRFDILTNGFWEHYTFWDLHGEGREPFFSSSRNVVDDYNDVFDPYEMLRDAGAYDDEWNDEDDDIDGLDPNNEFSKFSGLKDDAEVPLYPGSTKHTKLTFVSKLLHFKSTHGCSERGFNELLGLIVDVLPEDHQLPSNYNEIKKMLKDLSLGYEKIHACENDCMLFYGDDSEKQECNICGTGRYKVAKEGSRKSIPRKILRYFPLKSRLQRLYMSTRTAESMRWYKTREITNGIMTHPADGEEWKQFDINYPDFLQDIRNIRLGLATDGFSPYSNKTSRINYSVWPVIIVVYNLPPSMCMKDPYMYMTLLIPGEKSPTRDINVYLRPLIDELRQLWSVGVQTYDAFTDTNFTLRAALLWTINDFPALAMLSGWSTKGKLSCPVCMGDVRASQLPHSRKCSFWGAAKKFRRSRQNHRHQTGWEVHNKCVRITFPLPGKKSLKSRVAGFGVTHNFTHFSIFFELPYWHSLRLRHCIDVMHTEKNVFDNFFHTVMGTKKFKDTNNARADLKAFGIREELWMRGNSKPQAPYTLSQEQQVQVYNWISELKMPDGCASNIARCSKVEKKKLSGMKSHDCHVFMQRLLPSAFCGILPSNVHDALCNLSSYFKGICSTTIALDDLAILEKNIVNIMCNMENIFPGALFDPMEHVLLHLAEQCRLGGLVPYRWIYWVERQMRRMKVKVRNKAQVEGSIAERYAEEELVNFCSMFFESSAQTVHNMIGRNMVDGSMRDPTKLEVFTYPTRLFGASNGYFLDDKLLQIAANYVLFNMPEVTPYRLDFEAEMRMQDPQISLAEMNTLLDTQFKKWMFNKVRRDRDTYKRFKHLLRGPSPYVTNYRGCDVNGYRFKCTKSHSGVLVKGSCYDDTVSNYYGRLEEILVLFYNEENQVVLFKCHWFDNRRGIKVDKNQIITIDMTSKLRGNDVFVLASQATQVYYAPFRCCAWDILKETGEEPGECHLFLKMNTDKNDVCTSGEVGVMMERYIQLCEKENVDPNNAPIQTWAKAVGVWKNSIVGVPRTKASDIIPIERSRKRRRRRKDEESGASTNGRPSVLHMADDFLIQAVDLTVAYASAHPEEFGLAPEQISMFTKSVSMAEGEGELPSNHPLSMRTMTELVQVMLSVLTDIQAFQQPDKNNGKGKSVSRDDDCPGSDDDDDIRHPPHSPLADQCENGLD